MLMLDIVQVRSSTPANGAVGEMDTDGVLGGVLDIVMRLDCTVVPRSNPS